MKKGQPLGGKKKLRSLKVKGDAKNASPVKQNGDRAKKVRWHSKERIYHDSFTHTIKEQYDGLFLQKKRKKKEKNQRLRLSKIFCLPRI